MSAAGRSEKPLAVDVQVTTASKPWMRTRESMEALVGATESRSRAATRRPTEVEYEHTRGDRTPIEVEYEPGLIPSRR